MEYSNTSSLPCSDSCTIQNCDKYHFDDIDNEERDEDDIDDWSLLQQKEHLNFPKKKKNFCKYEKLKLRDTRVAKSG